MLIDSQGNWLKPSILVLTATDLTALMSFLLSKFFRILLTCVNCMLLLNLISLIQIPINTRRECRSDLCPYTHIIILK